MPFRNRQNMLLAVAGFCVLAFIGDRFIVTPLLDTWAERAARMEKLEKDLARGGQLLKREQNFEALWGDMLGRSLPSDKAEAESRVLRAVQRWAQTSRLELTTQTLRWIEDKDEYYKLEFQCSSDGSLTSIARFLYEMESDPSVAVRFEDAALVARDQQGSQLSMSVVFTGLALKEDAS